MAPLVKQIVSEILTQQGADVSRMGERLWIREAEAAALFGLPGHCLRDCRRRGEIVGTKIGKKIGYTREDLLTFLRGRRLDL